MAAYVCPAPDPRGEWYLWADDLTQATAAAIMSGAPWPDAHRPNRGPSQFSLTVEQWAAAVANGAVVRPLADCWDAAMRETGRLDLVGKLR